MKQVYIFRAWVRPMASVDWEEFCFCSSQDPDLAFLECRELAEDIFTDRLERGHYFANEAEWVVLPDGVTPYEEVKK